MALSAAAGSLRNASLLDQLLEEINFQRTKEMRQLLKDESGFVVVGGTTHWTDLFVRHFLFQEERGMDCDDLLFFVRKRHVRGSSRHLPKYEVQVEVFRKDSKKLPIGDPEVDWEETVYLNLVVHLFDYTLTLAVCTRTSPKELQVLRRRSHKVYASPSRRKMDTKGEGEEITYPHICFMVDNFDEVFEDIVVRDGEMVCVELAARGRGARCSAAIFLGSIRYAALARVHECRQSSLSTKVAQRMSFGLLGGRAAARCEFVRMKGPGGKGHAEVAVSRVAGSAGGADTPCSEPGDELGDAWDSDCEEDSSQLYLYGHQRRLSDPNLGAGAGAGGVSWRRAPRPPAAPPGAPSSARSEGAELDAAGLIEIEAGDVRDVRRGSAASSCCWRPRPAPPDRLSDVTTPRHRYDVTSTDLTPPRRRKPVVASKKKSKHRECEIADDALSLDEKEIVCCDGTRRMTSSGGRTTVRGREELPCYREREIVNLLGRREGPLGGQTGLRRARTWDPPPRGGPPQRVTPDGTSIYYWCDVPRRKHELDDGWWHPLQGAPLWRESRRRGAAPLAAGLTYVTLPWWSIAKDILDHREEPILTF